MKKWIPDPVGNDCEMKKWIPDPVGNDRRKEMSSSCLTRRSTGAKIKIMKQMYVYIMASHFNGTLYIGVTSDLIKRIWQHKNHVIDGFTSKYNVTKLVYYEILHDELAAIKREKQLKHWNRKWKIDLITKQNPYWNDLYPELLK